MKDVPFASIEHSVPFRRRLLALLVMAVCLTPGITQSQSIELTSPQQRATEFGAEVDAFVSALGLHVEKFAVRINRCQHTDVIDDSGKYYIWVGAQLVAPQSDATEMLAKLHSDWMESDWVIHRYRTMAEGGINLAARHQETQHLYALDSGFEAGPERYIVGTFSTPCLIADVGSFSYGEVKDWRDD